MSTLVRCRGLDQTREKIFCEQLSKYHCYREFSVAQREEKIAEGFQEDMLTSPAYSICLSTKYEAYTIPRGYWRTFYRLEDIE